jgi:hypothetical protein
MFIRNHQENVFSKGIMDLITRSIACRYDHRTMNWNWFLEGMGVTGCVKLQVSIQRKHCS